jgi:two-component system, chemotaxis family, chemotaxis protein CheY
MSKKVALVGHCGPDGSYLRMAVGAVEKGTQVIMVDDDGALRKALHDGVDLLLLNRVLDFGFEEHEGIAVIRNLRRAYPELKMMLVSNYPEAQAAAVAAGALPGFGKRDLGSARAKTMLREALIGPAGEASKV